MWLFGSVTVCFLLPANKILNFKLLISKLTWTVVLLRWMLLSFEGVLLSLWRLFVTFSWILFGVLKSWICSQESSTYNSYVSTAIKAYLRLLKSHLKSQCVMVNYFVQLVNFWRLCVYCSIILRNRTGHSTVHYST